MPSPVTTDDSRRFLQPHVVSRLAGLELRARLVVEGFIAGLHRSPYHGFSVEFAEHRPYMPGDEIRHVDWKLYGKTDRFHVKQYEEETNLKAFLLVDTSRSMEFSAGGRMSKFEYARLLAAALALLMQRQRDAVGLGLFDETLTAFLPPHATRVSLMEILTTLGRARPGGRTGTGRALHQVADRVRRRGLVIIFSDLLDDPDDVLAALKHFRHAKNEVIVMNILDPLERDFAFGDAASFRDLETGEQMTTLPWHIQDAYRDAVHTLLARYRRECLEHAIDYVFMDTATPFDVALGRYLSKRRMLF